jgi:Methyltransferase FkbM domain
LPYPGDDAPTTEFFSRASAARVAEIRSLDYAREYFNAGAEMALATDRIVLDEYFGDDEARCIDFVKVDTDGHDFEVLRGCDRILSEGRVLGVAVEAQFQGPVSVGSGVFSDVDSFLRYRGFSLFDLEVYRYSRAALPAPFVYDLPAQTTNGQVFLGDAIYFRDLGHPSYEEMWPFRPRPVDILKLACLFEIFGLPDCSAELILKYGAELGTTGELDRLLDVLAVEQGGRAIGYSTYLEEFAATARARLG